MSRRTAIRLLLVAFGLSLALLGAEFALRLQLGEMLDFSSTKAVVSAGHPRVEYHSELGWLPTPGPHNAGSWSSTVDRFHYRQHQTDSQSPGEVLVVGDSYAFGDEVDDEEAWPAVLESLGSRKVLNAGVGAYGLDQSVLRAEALLPEVSPSVLILAFISDDISRSEYNNYPYGNGPKPFFRLRGGELQLENVPVPRQTPAKPFAGLRRLLGYSRLSDRVLGRFAPGWWAEAPSCQPVHHDGEAIAVALIRRLDRLCRDRGVKLIVVPLACGPQIGDNSRLAPVVEAVTEDRVEVLNLAREAVEAELDKDPGNFRPGGHYSPKMNAWVATRLVESYPSLTRSGR